MMLAHVRRGAGTSHATSLRKRWPKVHRCWRGV